MAQLGRFNFVLQDRLGNALQGVSVTVRKQAGSVNGAQAGIASGANILMHNVGGLATGDSVNINAGSTTYTCTVVDATHIQLSGFAGTIDLADADRIHSATNLPNAYTNPEGNGSAISWPQTTDADGKASNHMRVEPYTLYFSGGALSSPEIRYDECPSGVENMSSNVRTTGSAVAYKRDTRNALAVGDKHTQFLVVGVEIGYLDYIGNLNVDGGVTAGGAISGTNLTLSGTLAVTGAATLSSTLAVTGAVTLSSTLAVTGATTLTGLLTANGGLTVVGALTLPAGSVETADLAANAVSATQQTVGTGDQTAAAAAAYNLANYQDITGLTAVSFTPNGTASELIIIGEVHTQNNGAPYGGYVALTNGSNAILAEGGFTDGTSTTDLTVTTTLVHRITGVSGAQTYKLRHQCTAGTAYDIHDSSHAAKLRTSRITIIELKK